MKLAMTILAAALLCAAGTAGAKDLKGQYTVHYFSGPTHAEADTRCVIFKHTGAVAGFPDSGTWKVRNKLSGGNFVVDGGVIRFYGTADKGVEEINHRVDAATLSGSYDVWKFSAIPVTAIDDGAVQMQAGCQ